MNTPLFNPEKVYLPLLYMKLRIINYCIKAMDQNSAGFIYLDKFPKISNAKNKEWVFVRPQIRQLTKDVIFEDHLSEVGKTACKSLKNSTNNFRGKIISQKFIAIWWLISKNPTKLWGVMCL